MTSAGPIFVNNSTEDLRLMFATSSLSSPHSIVIILRLVNSFFILCISLLLQTMDPGMYISLCGVLFCITSGAFPIIMHLKARKQVTTEPEGTTWATTPLVSGLTLGFHLLMLTAMIWLFRAAGENPGSTNS